MYETSDFKKGLKILIKEDPWVILDFQHVKPGKGNQFTRTKLKNLLSGANVDMTFRSGEKFPIPDISYKALSYIYRDSSGFHFMDQKTCETYVLNESLVGALSGYLLEGQEISGCFFNGKAVSIELPKTVILKVKETEPGFKGDTVSGGALKKAVMETGLEVQVPLHIHAGDKLKISSQDGSYIERSS